MQTLSAITSGCQSTAMNGSIRIGTEIETQEMAIGCQSIEDQNTEKMASPQEIIPNGSLSSPQSGNTQAEAPQPPAKESPGGTNRHRKRALVMREIPLYMLPAALNCCVRARGDKVYRIVIVRTHWHHYTIKVRCSTKKATGQTVPSQHTDLTNTPGSSTRGGGT